MSETTSACRWAGSDRPRVLPGRHDDDCANETCAGCQPCTAAHCRVCGIEHSAGTCGGCLDEARTNLAEIRRMCADLPAEVEHRGVNGEAMVLLGPTANPEAWGYRSASVLAGRIVPADCDARELDDVKAWLAKANDERHPLACLGGWEMAYRDAFEHDTAELVTVEGAAAYLAEMLSTAARYEYVPFEDFARDLRRCRGHLEDVLTDGERTERTRVTCVNDRCTKRPRLERRYGEGQRPDVWRCPACLAEYDDKAYRDAHAKQLRHAGSRKYLPLEEAVSTLVAQGRSENTIRAWLKPHEPDDDVVLAYCDIKTRRRWVWWPDLWSLHLTTKTRKRKAA